MYKTANAMIVVNMENLVVTLPIPQEAKHPNSQPRFIIGCHNRLQSSCHL
jgi:hypothetical protein